MTMHDRAETILQLLQSTPGHPEATGAARSLLIEVETKAMAADAEAGALETARAVLLEREEALAVVMEETDVVGLLIREALADSQGAVEGLPIPAGA